MEYKNVLKDFIARTKCNIQIIEKSKENGEEAYEVTQLINSCLGLLVMPQQQHIKSIPKIPLEKLVDDGWAVPKIVGDFPQVKDLSELIRYLRNAISHFNIEFISDCEVQLKTLKVWNINRGKRTWVATLGIDELKTIIDKFEEVLTGIE